MIAGMSREEILKRFEHWLDQALAAEEPPRGIEVEILSEIAGEEEPAGAVPGADAYSLWAAVTALTQEVKLQGRAFKELAGALAAQAASGEEREEVRRETERRCRKEALAVLIDLRDRLLRGWDSVRAAGAGLERAAPRPWWAWRRARSEADRAAAALAALKRGYEMGLERLDQVLEEANAREIPCEGQPFDPRRMNAVERLESNLVPEGTVVAVYRRGYEWNGEVLRAAQVGVSCAPAEGPSGGKDE